MNESYIMQVKNPEVRAIVANNDDIIESSVNTLQNPKDVRVTRYLAIKNDNSKLKVEEAISENTIGIIQEHIVVKYKFKEVWELFVKFLFGIPKINNIRFRVIKDQ